MRITLQTSCRRRANRVLLYLSLTAFALTVVLGMVLLDSSTFGLRPAPTVTSPPLTDQLRGFVRLHEELLKSKMRNIRTSRSMERARQRLAATPSSVELEQADSTNGSQQQRHKEFLDAKRAQEDAQYIDGRAALRLKQAYVDLTQ